MEEMNPFSPLPEYTTSRPGRRCLAHR